MKRLILFLIRRHLGLKKYEYFQFVNQKTRNVYYFTYEHVVKMEPTDDKWYQYNEELKGRYKLTKSNVSLNWLLDDDCEIKKLA